MNNEDKDAIDAITDEANAKVQKIDDEFHAKAEELHARAAKLKRIWKSSKKGRQKSVGATGNPPGA